jgi:hypothetical protein
MGFPDVVAHPASRRQASAVSPVCTRLLPPLRIRLGLPDESHRALVDPLIQGLAEALPLAPSGSDAPQVDFGEQLQRALLFGLRALAVRHDRILPPNASPEELGDLAHRWTYSVFVAALLQGVAEPGSAPADLLFDRVVPDLGRRWLAEDPRLQAALADTLRGKAGRDNPIAEILRLASGATAPVSPVTSPIADCPKCEAGAEQPEASIAQTRPSERVDDWPAGQAGEFLGWLRHALASRSIQQDAADSPVHRVAEGLLLVWPGAFRWFLDARGGGSASGDALKKLRQSVLEAGWHLPADDAAGLHFYAWREGGKPERSLRGVVISRAERLIDPLTPVSPKLVRIDAPSARQP